MPAQPTTSETTYDLLIQNGTVVSVFTGETFPGVLTKTYTVAAESRPSVGVTEHESRWPGAATPRRATSDSAALRTVRKTRSPTVQR